MTERRRRRTVNALVLSVRHFRPASLPRKYAAYRGREGKCRTNALMLAWRMPALTYCEGSAIPQIGHKPVAHAWCITSDGRVADPTWDPCGVAYVGCPTNYAFVCHTVLELGRKRDIENWEADHSKSCINREK